MDLKAVYQSGFIDAASTYDMGHPSPETIHPDEQFRGAFFLQESPAMDAIFW